MDYKLVHYGVYRNPDQTISHLKITVDVTDGTFTFAQDAYISNPDNIRSILADPAEFDKAVLNTAAQGANNLNEVFYVKAPVHEEQPMDIKGYSILPDKVLEISKLNSQALIDTKLAEEKAALVEVKP